MELGPVVFARIKRANEQTKFYKTRQPATTAHRCIAHRYYSVQT